MENPDKAFLVSIVKSLFPRRSEPANVSRNFWMPDHSCRVCYECDSQFTVFNRRHHCRLCGRIFCGKCTANFIPVASANPERAKEDCERIRVCNFCFKQWEQRVPPADDATHLCFSPSLSSTSLFSNISTGTANSMLTAGSYLTPTGPYHHIPYGPAPNPSQPVQLESCLDKSDIQRSARSIDTANIGSHQFGYAMNRSDEDDYEYGALDNSETQLQSYDHYGGPDEFNGVDQNCHSNKVHLAEVKISLEDICSTVPNTHFHTNLNVNKVDENEPDSSYECNASSSIYDIENADAEPVDFENNGLLWLPPDPEDEEDEKEHILLDDDEDPTGEWKYDHSSNSFDSGEHRTRERSGEGHKKAMKNVVDGHFRALIAQLLQVENLPVGEDDRGNWLDIVTSLSWEAANFLKPDTSNSGGMDPGGHVKIKCLACGHRSERW
ncbi:1-phosphatidylinositol-3-phosphate 5-kinase FAB1B-like isoform X1 [Canna indica]|uniref:Phosphatidylinositol 3-phosphate 5-kinase type III n=1 Tax=Canna indica TaxID=4628 RepID=A0AAQ3QB40_9LILI|nr:1-phosphatidylinositol-3-phosphate 5-kinase FAB1B-like isoform X1 [Canna indica]